MSTYVGYTCFTCRDDSPTYYNHGEARLLEILEHYPLLKQVQKAQEIFGDGCTPRIQVDWRDIGRAEEENPIEFLIRHEGHLLFLKDEYGRLKEIPEKAKPPERDWGDL